MQLWGQGELEKVPSGGDDDGVGGSRIQPKTRR